MTHKWPDYVSNFSDFTENEAILLDEHFDFYWGLYNEERPAKTDLQKQFITNCAGGTPETRHECAFYKFLVQSGNVEASTDEPHEPISDPQFLAKLTSVVRDQGFLDFYTNNRWDEYVESRYDFTVDEAYILDLESGYLAAVYDEVIEAPDESVNVLVENCYNEAPQSLREKAFYKFLEHATFPEFEEPKAGGEQFGQAKVEELPPSENSEIPPFEEDDESSSPEEIEEEPDNSEDERVDGGYLSQTGPLPPIKVKKAEVHGEGPFIHAGPTTRGPATTTEILGGRSSSEPYWEVTAGTDSFGNRASWKRMRGSNRKYRK